MMRAMNVATPARTNSNNTIHQNMCDSGTCLIWWLVTESTMNLVTAKIDSGISEAATRKLRFETTIPGAASHTKRSTAGMFFSARIRSLQLGNGATFIVVLAAAISAILRTSKHLYVHFRCQAVLAVNLYPTYGCRTWQTRCHRFFALFQKVLLGEIVGQESLRQLSTLELNSFQPHNTKNTVSTNPPL